MPHRRDHPGESPRTTRPVRDGTLHITFDHHRFGDSDPVVEASVPRLSGIDASGSGDVTADGIEAGAFDVRSDGSGDVEYHGDPSLTKHLDGSGDLSQGD